MTLFIRATNKFIHTLLAVDFFLLKLSPCGNHLLPQLGQKLERRRTWDVVNQKICLEERACSHNLEFKNTRPKPAYGRQGLDWIVRPIFLQLHFAFLEHIPPILRPRLTSFDPKTWRDRRGAPTDLLWSKNMTWQTRGPNWPPLIQKR